MVAAFALVVVVDSTKRANESRSHKRFTEVACSLQLLVVIICF